ncbi:glyoxalase [Sphingomonas sp. AP4-R1]|uniref:glyoxalase n=1 Tax=Sphingomonas sp. AP4-R1 TaxID=2735134 RepID=UPI0014932E5E|nr:glyoxalase [Sphingomonas sp. AP4-R1]QJU58769.1 glyoxalase [Sphingomonas sp. AP4-R1]
MNRLTLILTTALIAVTPATSFAREAPETATADHAIGPQYDTTHVYVAPGDFDRFVTSLTATFGGTATKKGEFQVTPTTSKTMSQLVLTPAGSLSVFGFLTPVPVPFGAERTGYLVDDMDAAVASARKAGAARLITTFLDPIGRDVVVQWAGGVNMQLYWHTTKPNYPALATVPENRIYLTSDVADTFLRQWSGFAHAKVLSDDKAAPGAEIGRPGTTYRRVRLSSGYGKMAVIVSDGQLPWPYGRDMTGYEVSDLTATLAKAAAAGVEMLVPAHDEGDRTAALVRFPGGYIAEIHAPVAK